MWERLEKVNLDPDVSKDQLIKLFGPPDLEWDNFQFWGEFNAVDDKGKEGPRHVFAAIYDRGKLNAYHKVRPIFVDGTRNSNGRLWPDDVEAGREKIQERGREISPRSGT